jgi:hypothetical protein
MIRCRSGTIRPSRSVSKKWSPHRVPHSTLQILVAGRGGLERRGHGLPPLAHTHAFYRALRGIVPDGYEAFHVDGNRANLKPSNLEIRPKSRSKSRFRLPPGSIGGPPSARSPHHPSSQPSSGAGSPPAPFLFGWLTSTPNSVRRSVDCASPALRIEELKRDIHDADLHDRSRALPH